MVKMYHIVILILAFVLNAVMSNMSPFRDCLFCCDVNVFYTMGKCWVLGYVPYVDFIDIKGPLLILIFAIGYLMSPESTTGVYILASFATYLTLLYLYKTAYHYLGNSLKSFLVILCCAAALFFKCYYGYGPRSEQFLLPLIALLIWFTCVKYDSLESDRKCRLLYGACLGGSTAAFFLVKFIYVLFPMFLAACAIAGYWKSENRIRIASQLLLAYVVSFVVVSLPFFVYFVYTSSLDEFLWVYFTLMSDYLSNGEKISLLQKVELLAHGLFGRCVYQPAFWCALVSILSLVTPYYKKRMILRTRVVCMVSFFVLVMTCGMGLWPYYLLMYFPLLLFPAVAIVEKISHSKCVLGVLCAAVFLFTLGNYLVILNIRQNQAFDAALPSWSNDYKAVEDIIKRKKRAKIMYLDMLDQGLGIRTGAVPAGPVWFSWYSKNEELKNLQKEIVEKRLPDFVCTWHIPSPERQRLLEESGYKAEITFVNYAGRKSAITLWSKSDDFTSRQ